VFAVAFFEKPPRGVHAHGVSSLRALPLHSLSRAGNPKPEEKDTMTKFIIRRFLSLIPTMFIIITLSFALIRLAPGGPFSGEKNLPPQVIQNMLKKYHMDEPIMKQYVRYFGDVLRGDFGPSLRYKESSVNELVGQGFPVSIVLGTTSLLIACFLGILVGIISALKQNRWQDYTAMSLAVVGISVPLFVIGPVLQLVFAMKLKWLPVAGWITGRAGIAALIMPAITLALPYFAYIARLSRASILEVLRADYVRTARAKGLKESVVITKHVLKGALLPVVSFLGPSFAGIITGSLVVESTFAIPGIGRIFVQSALNRDYPLIMAEVIILSLLLVVLNFVVDIVYGFLDPRIAYK
jgi:oligopeptide transport system permease protein